MKKLLFALAFLALAGSAFASTTKTSWPTGDISQTGPWYATGATYVYQCLSNTASGSPYVYSYSGGYNYYATFQPLGIPSNATNISVSLTLGAYTHFGGAGGPVATQVLVNGSAYLSSTQSITGTVTLYSFSFANNPNTSSAWTIDDLNGTGSHPLQGIGIYNNGTTNNFCDLSISVTYDIVSPSPTVTPSVTPSASPTSTVTPITGPSEAEIKKTWWDWVQKIVNGGK